MHNPMVGRITDTYNLRRVHPVFKTTQPHRGIDLGAPVGTQPWEHVGADVRAAYGGVVEEVCTNWRTGWGAIWGRSGDGVFIRNPDGEAQYYGHLSRVNVRKGQRVTEGQVIGGMGSSGNVTGPHLHFEIHSKGSGRSNNWTWTRDPMADFNAAGITPGVDPATITPASPATPEEFTVTQVNEIISGVAQAVADISISVTRGGKAATRSLATLISSIDSQGIHNTTRISELEGVVEKLAEKTGLTSAEVQQAAERGAETGAEKAIADGVDFGTATITFGKDN